MATTLNSLIISLTLDVMIELLLNMMATTQPNEDKKKRCETTVGWNFEIKWKNSTKQGVLLSLIK